MTALECCPLCESTSTEMFAEVRDVPVHVGVLWPTRELARGCPRGDIALAFCRSCGFIWNTGFDPDQVDYTQDYKNSLAGSPAFRAFDTDLAKNLVTRYDIHDSTVIEIGCGDARFLSLLCEFGDNVGIGFDPSRTRETPAADPHGSVHVVPDYFGPDHGIDACALVVCRHVLEHVADPHELIRLVGDQFDNDTVVYFEVPSALMPLRNLSVWDMMYEHCSYFAPEPLQHLFALNGYDVLDTVESFSGQFVGIEARPGSARRTVDRPDVSYLVALVRDFREHISKRLDDWNRRLVQWRGERARVAVWGGGARAVSYFAMLGITEEIACVVDVNEHKQGTFLAGSGHEIVAPEHLREVQPERVVIVNPVYEEEIRAELSALGVRAEVVVA